MNIYLGITHALLNILVLKLVFVSSVNSETVITSEVVKKPRAIRLLPLGDSITAGDYKNGSYRRLLWLKLKYASVNFDFIGTQGRGFFDWFYTSDYDVDHEGHWGWETADILKELPSWLAKIDAPDIVLIHLGTNDLFREREINNSLKNLSEIILLLKQINSDVKIYIAQIIPTWGMVEQVGSYNKALVEKFIGLEASKIYLVDMSTGFDLENFTYDGVHTNLAGAEWLSDKWFAAMQ